MAHEAENTSADLPREERQRRLARVRRRSAVCGRARSRLLLRDILAADGEPIVSGALATQALLEHRQQVFSAADIGEDIVDGPSHSGGIRRSDSAAEQRVSGSRRRSYTAWHGVSPTARGVLADVVTALLTRERSQVWVGDSQLVFIPKARETVSLGLGEVAAAAGYLRPLSPSKTDTKLVACVSTVVLLHAASK